MIKKDCNIVKDLLPNYIDKLTSNETNIFIEEHLKNCELCKKSFEDMSKEIEVDYKNSNDKKVKAFKKVNKKIKGLKAIIFIILLAFILVFARKLVIINNIENKAGRIDYSNYSKIMTETTEKYISKTEYYQNNDNFVKINTKINKDGISKVISYSINGKEDIRIIENGSENENINKNSIEKDVQYQYLNKSFMGNIGIALSWNSVRNINLYNKQCYLLNIENYLNFIDKESGLTIKEININNNSVIDYKYTFGDVTDEKIEKLINNL